jgi:hypothetical protein
MDVTNNRENTDTDTDTQHGNLSQVFFPLFQKEKGQRGCNGVGWIQLAQDIVEWCILDNTIIIPWV